MADEDTKLKRETRAAAYRGKSIPGPDGAPVQIRQAGPNATRDEKKQDWDETDEASDESFPASDPGAKY